MSSSSSSCGYFINTNNQATYGFQTYNLLSSPTNSFTIIWQTPLSGVIFISSNQINPLEGTNPSNPTEGIFYFPSNVTYYTFINQKIWTVNVDLSKYYVGVLVYDIYAPVCFSILVDGQILSVAIIKAKVLYNASRCPYSYLGLETQLSNGLLLLPFLCTSFGPENVGDTSIPLGGSNYCPGFTECVGCPQVSSTTSNTPQLVCQQLIMPPPCFLPRFLNLPVLSPPAPKSTISSSLWNAIVNNIYSAYNSLMKIKNALSSANFSNLLTQAYAIYDALYVPTPYAFTPLLQASKGVPLTADDFNALVKALEQVYNELRQPLPYSISPAFGDAIVKSDTFAKIVSNLNALRQSALQSVLLTSTTGAELNSLPSNFTGQNVFVCSISNNVILSGAITIENLLIVQVASTLTIGGNVSISRLIVQNLYNSLTLQGTANMQNIAVGTLSGTLTVTDFASVQNLFVNEIQPGGSLVIGGNAYVQNLVVNSCSSGSIVIQDYALVNNLGGMAQQCVTTYSS